MGVDRQRSVALLLLKKVPNRLKFQDETKPDTALRSRHFAPSFTGPKMSPENDVERISVLDKLSKRVIVKVDGVGCSCLIKPFD